MACFCGCDEFKKNPDGKIMGCVIVIMEDKIMIMNGVNLQERMLNNHRNEILTLDNLFANNFY